MQNVSQEAQVFLAEVEHICAADPRLSPLAGAVLAGITLGFAHDSRSCAKALGLEHALVLREVQDLADFQRLAIAKRDPRTQRCHYQLLPAAENDNL